MRLTTLLSFLGLLIVVAAGTVSKLENRISHNDLETRAKPKSNSQGNKAPPVVKPNAPAGTPAKRPPIKSTPTPNPTLNKPTSPGKKLPPSRTCKQIAMDEIKLEKLQNEEDIADGRAKRSPHSLLLQRGQPKEPKGANRPCTANSFASNDFESFGVEKVQNPDAPVYGYEVFDSCTDYKFFSGVTTRALKRTLQDYQTEHVLEWQTVAEFFGKYVKAQLSSQTFPSPDPLDLQRDGTSRKPLDFCGAWKKTWSNEPAGLTFALAANGPRRTPFQHIADVYPSKDGYRHEFTLLQGRLNGLKARFFSASVLYDEDDKMVRRVRKPGMRSLVNDEPRQAIQRLRSVLGVRKYLDQAKVRTAMRDVKVRLQTRFDDIETALALPANRKVIPAQGGRRPVQGRTFDAWQPRGLGALWHQYMNDKWAEAKRKHEVFLQTWHQKIYEKYCTPPLKRDSRDGPNDTPNVLLRKRNTREACPALDAFRKEWKNSKQTGTAFGRPWP